MIFFPLHPQMPYTERVELTLKGAQADKKYYINQYNTINKILSRRSVMLPVQITLRNVSLSPVLERNIRKRADKLTHFYHRIMSCRVVVELPQKHKHQGKLFNARIILTIPHKELVVTHKNSQDIYIVIREAFKAMERQLEDYARKQQGHVKTHTDVMRGRIVRIIAKDGFGFIKGMDGNEYYFSLTNVHYPQFKQLAIGDAVEYFIENMNGGHQAHHVIKKERRHKNHLTPIHEF